MAKCALLALAFANTILAAVSCLTGGTNSRTIVSDGYWPTQSFKSVPYTPPQFQINTSSTALAPGYILLTLNVARGLPGITQNGPTMMTSSGELVWNGRRNTYPINLNIQQYAGQPVLTYWLGVPSSGNNLGHGYGAIVITNTSYNIIAEVCPKIPGFTTPDNITYACHFDLHEAYITERDTVLATAYNVRQADLSSIGGPKHGWVFSGMIVETDIATNNVVFQWDSIDHVPVSASHKPLGKKGVNSSVPMDYFHINSIQLVGENYLVNSRDIWSSFLVNPKGRIIWELNGATGGDFGTLPANGNFAWQHHVRLFNNTADSFTLSIFNNDDTDPVPRASTLPSSGLVLVVPNVPGSAPVVVQQRVLHQQLLYSPAEGSNDIQLANQNQLLGWGDMPFVSEHGPDGTQLWSAQFTNVSVGASYRAHKKEWSATPYYPPTLVVKGDTSAGCNTAYVSWNGATDITAWAVYAGPSASSLTKLGKVNRAGFETSFGWGGTCVKVTAMRNGTEIRSSAVKCI